MLFFPVNRQLATVNCLVAVNRQLVTDEIYTASSSFKDNCKCSQKA